MAANLRQNAIFIHIIERRHFYGSLQTAWLKYNRCFHSLSIDLHLPELLKTNSRILQFPGIFHHKRVVLTNNNEYTKEVPAMFVCSYWIQLKEIALQRPGKFQQYSFVSPPRFLGKDYCFHLRSSVRPLVRKILGKPFKEVWHIWFSSGHLRAPPGTSGHLRAFPPGISSGHLWAFPPGTSGHPPGTSGLLRAPPGILRAFPPGIFCLSHFLPESFFTWVTFPPGISSRHFLRAFPPGISFGQN